MRMFLSLIGVLALLQGTWLTATDVTEVWSGLTQTDAFSQERVATVGLWRGDLWARAALAFAASRPNDPGHFEAAKRYAIRSLSLAPLQSSLWLLLALKTPTGEPSESSDAALQLAFITGGGRRADVPLRLRAAGQTPSLMQGDLKDWVANDIRHILIDDPGLREALKQAYRTALPENRVIFNEIVRSIDSNFSLSSP